MSELSLSEIRAFMLKNNCKVTNHALVKHFKKYLTDPDTQGLYKISKNCVTKVGTCCFRRDLILFVFEVN